MSTQDMEFVVFEIISHAGTAKGLAYEALQAAEAGDYEKAKQMLDEADEALLGAHHVQTSLIQKEAAGDKTEVSMLFVHAQDHLMTAIEAKNLITHIIKLNQKVDELKK